jgi:DNA-binding GntR family transcriptional regulator
MPVPSNVSPRRALLRDDAYQRLRDAIVDGTLEPGERLRDAELGVWLGVSRTPVREALARLEQAGLVITRPGRSTTVAPLDVRAARDAQSVVAAMHQLAVRLAVPHLSDDELARMSEANDRFSKALRAGDVDAALQADDELHAVPVSAAANRAVQQVLEQFTPLLRRVERLRFSSLTGRGSVALHADLIDRCRAGDADGAAAISWDTWQTLEPLLGVDGDATPSRAVRRSPRSTE